MNQITFTVPRLYADHHVTHVRQILLPLSGVENVVASSAFKQVTVDFDAERIALEALEAALTQAGYAPGELEEIERTPDHTSDPAWDRLSPRAVTTNVVDLQMSGEFRKY